MKRNKLLLGTGAAVAIVILILDSKTALDACSNGINLCFFTIIPSLFPFFFLTNCVSSTFSGIRISILQPLACVMGIPKGAESVLINSFLGGYPAGAQTVSRYKEAGFFPETVAARLIPLCNNAGPSFIFGIAARMFPFSYYGVGLWLIQIGATILTSLIFSPLPCPAVSSYESEGSIDKNLKLSIKAITVVCAWVVLFRIVIEFMNKWVMYRCSPIVRVVAYGLLELSNGCCMLSEIRDISIRFVICSSLLSLGGVCVTMQTMSITSDFSAGYYLLVKSVHCMIATTLSCVFLCGRWAYIAAGVILAGILLYKKKKIIENKETIMYNASTISGGAVYVVSKEN